MTAARPLRVLLNRGGRVVARGPEAVAARVTAAFAAHGGTVEIRLVPGAELAAEATAARDLAQAGALAAVVVGGGDGSVGTVAGVLADSGVPMGVLPLGTLNHFAKDLGLPGDLDAAAAVVVAGRTRAVDVGEVGGRAFVNNAVIGVYPYMVGDRERRRRQHGLGKWVAMSLALLRMLARFPRRRLKLRTPAGETRYRTPLLFVGTAEYRLSGLTLRRTGGLDSGTLWLLVARHQTPWGLDPGTRNTTREIRGHVTQLGRSGDT
jgi:diacylglycerol kinase family enzyme